MEDKSSPEGKGERKRRKIYYSPGQQWLKRRKGYHNPGRGGKEEKVSLQSWPAVVEEEEEEEELLQSWPAVTYIWIGGEKVGSYSPEISVK